MAKPDLDSRCPLRPVQTCFVVEDVDAAARTCEEQYGWGPFVRFSAPSPGDHPDAVTHVALGNAGATNIELIRTEHVRNTVSEYQERYGVGFQHIGVLCPDIDAGIRALERLGAKARERESHARARFAFVDAPTGPGMIELLQPERDAGETSGSRDSREQEVLVVDSATIVTRDIEEALTFFSGAFAWETPEVSDESLEIEGRPAGHVRRARHQAGTLRLELVQPLSGDNPYSHHLATRDHGLVHVGAKARASDRSASGRYTGRWLESGESFRFLAAPFGPPGIRIDEAYPAGGPGPAG